MKLYPALLLGPVLKSDFRPGRRAPITSWIITGFVFLGFIFLGFMSSLDAKADSRTCIARLPYRLTSEYKVRGWEVTLPNSLAAGNLIYNGALAYQSMQSFASFGNPVASYEDVGSNDVNVPLFFAPYTRPLIYGVGYAAEVYRGVRSVFRQRDWRAQIKAVTLLTYGAHMALLRQQSERPFQTPSEKDLQIHLRTQPELRDFLRRLEPSEKARGLSSFSKLVQSVQKDQEGLPLAVDHYWANLIINADRLGLLCSEKSLYQGMSAKEVRRIFVERVRTQDLEREIQGALQLQKAAFKNAVAAALPTFKEVTESDQMDFEFTQQEFERWHPGFYKFILEELGEVAEETLEQRFAKVKFYKYLVTRIPDQVVNFRAPWFRPYVPSEIMAEATAEMPAKMQKEMKVE